MDSPSTRRRLRTVALTVGAAQALVWIWAGIAFHGHAALLGTTLVAYALGLRHGADADHIAAIDNVTRRLLQAGRPAESAGAWFAFGHSTVVFALTGAVVGGTRFFAGRLDRAGVIGTFVSIAFLLLVGAANAMSLPALYRRWRFPGAGPSAPPAAVGFLARRCARMFGLVQRSWHMYPLGFLFGLGFDTATEVALLAVAARAAASGLPPAALLVFPAAFAAGMALVDTADGFLMLGVYRGAAPRAGYNLATTAASVVLAVVVAALELLGWDTQFVALGCGVMVFFALCRALARASGWRSGGDAAATGAGADCV